MRAAVIADDAGLNKDEVFITLKLPRCAHPPARCLDNDDIGFLNLFRFSSDFPLAVDQCDFDIPTEFSQFSLSETR